VIKHENAHAYKQNEARLKEDHKPLGHDKAPRKALQHAQRAQSPPPPSFKPKCLMRCENNEDVRWETVLSCCECVKEGANELPDVWVKSSPALQPGRLSPIQLENHQSPGVH
jgi:hypothetical protein